LQFANNLHILTYQKKQNRRIIGWKRPLRSSGPTYLIAKVLLYSMLYLEKYF